MLLLFSGNLGLLVLVGDHYLEFPFEDNVELVSMLAEAEDIFARIEELVLQFRTEIVNVKLMQISLLEEGEFFHEGSQHAQIVTEALLARFKQYLNDSLNDIS